MATLLLGTRTSARCSPLPKTTWKGWLLVGRKKQDSIPSQATRYHFAWGASWGTRPPLIDANRAKI